MTPNPINQAIRTMAQSPNGGYAASAAMLGMTTAALENRLYEVKGQRIGIAEAMLLQRLTDRTDFAAAVAAESGGVFVPVPEMDAAALLGEDIRDHLHGAVEELGQLFVQWRESTADGFLSRPESAELWAQVRGVVSHLVSVAALTDRIYGGFSDAAEKP